MSHRILATLGNESRKVKLIETDLATSNKNKVGWKIAYYIRKVDGWKETDLCWRWCWRSTLDEFRAQCNIMLDDWERTSNNQKD